jgi:hypothetical protein
MKSKNNKNILKTLGIVLAVVIFCLLVLYLTNSNLLEGMEKMKEINSNNDVGSIEQRLKKLVEDSSESSGESVNPDVKKEKENKDSISGFTKENFLGSLFQ